MSVSSISQLDYLQKLYGINNNNIYSSSDTNSTFEKLLGNITGQSNLTNTSSNLKDSSDLVSGSNSEDLLQLLQLTGLQNQLQSYGSIGSNDDESTESDSDSYFGGSNNYMSQMVNYIMQEAIEKQIESTGNTIADNSFYYMEDKSENVLTK
ncbi:hypothetical protein [Clostridium oryzae]|uniref:Uncharacterized protein n=1 Tax=Clostridium oryzae TaxID=1450648 RepID=A0A1V4IUJ8_9CLOT|nr:hypothetical protein [Clostridium oryzae]OPJ63454.1 hypothetical protein CLORY_12410 [Clostridium oryzae]